MLLSIVQYNTARRVRLFSSLSISEFNTNVSVLLYKARWRHKVYSLLYRMCVQVAFYIHYSFIRGRRTISLALRQIFQQTPIEARPQKICHTVIRWLICFRFPAYSPVDATMMMGNISARTRRLPSSKPRARCYAHYSR